MRIRAGGPDDAQVVLDLFDEAVAWLVARGQTGQWGTEPFSAFERRVEKVREWAGGDGLRIAERSGEPVGALVPAPTRRGSSRPTGPSATSRRSSLHAATPARTSAAR